MQELLEDRAAPKICLSELRKDRNIYGIGSLSKMRGEIMIWNSRPYQSRTLHGRVQVKSDWQESAALLVWSSVPNWRRISMPPAVRGVDSMESWLDSMSGRPGAPLPAEYPFLIKGRFGHLLWQIATPRKESARLTREKYGLQQFHGQSHFVKGEIVGFYSLAAAGIHAPAGRHLHMHIRSTDGKLMAHLEDFDPVVDSDLSFYVPAGYH